MFVLHSYQLAVAFCVITMLCWGSWANTQKLAGQRWQRQVAAWSPALMLMNAALLAFLAVRVA